MSAILHKVQSRAAVAAVVANSVPSVIEESTLRRMDETQYMAPAQLAFFKHRLEALAHRLTSQVDLAKDDFAHTECAADPVDRASDEESRTALMRAQAREAEMLVQVRMAINRINTVEYGWCEETGEPIGIERLLAQPTARFSIDAQQSREKRAKHHAN